MKNNFPFPKPEYMQHLRDFYLSVNGENSFTPDRHYNGDNWTGQVICSRGEPIEKAGFSWLELKQGVMNEEKADITLFETLAHPLNPLIPGFIIMTNMNESPSAGRMIVFYSDLILLDGNPHDEGRSVFSEAVSSVCSRHNHDYEAYRAFTAEYELLGGYAACCGFLNFFTEEDIPFLDEMIFASISAYGKILNQQTNVSPRQEDFERANTARARMVDWILSKDYGVKLARENELPMEMIEAYGFPPVVKY